MENVFPILGKIDFKEKNMCFLYFCMVPLLEESGESVRKITYVSIRNKYIFTTEKKSFYNQNNVFSLLRYTFPLL